MQIRFRHCNSSPDLFAPMPHLSHVAYKLWVYLCFSVTPTLEPAAISRIIGCSRSTVYTSIEELMRKNYIYPTGTYDIYDFYEVAPQ